jgi:hypothetical protein
MIKRECLNLFQEEFEDTKGIIRIRKSKRNRRYNVQKKKYKRTNNDLQNIHKKLKIEKHEQLKTWGELRCSRKVGSSCSTSDSRRVNLVTNPVISYEWGKDREVFTTSGTYPWSFVTHVFHSDQPSHGRDRKTFEVMTST